MTIGTKLIDRALYLWVATMLAVFVLPPIGLVVLERVVLHSLNLVL